MDHVRNYNCAEEIRELLRTNVIARTSYQAAYNEYLKSKGIDTTQLTIDMLAKMNKATLDHLGIPNFTTVERVWRHTREHNDDLKPPLEYDCLKGGDLIYRNSLMQNVPYPLFDMCFVQGVSFSNDCPRYQQLAFINLFTNKFSTV